MLNVIVPGYKTSQYIQRSPSGQDLLSQTDAFYLQALDFNDLLNASITALS